MGISSLIYPDNKKNDKQTTEQGENKSLVLEQAKSYTFIIYQP